MEDISEDEGESQNDGFTKLKGLFGGQRASTIQKSPPRPKPTFTSRFSEDVDSEEEIEQGGMYCGSWVRKLMIFLDADEDQDKRDTNFLMNLVSPMKVLPFFSREDVDNREFDKTNTARRLLFAPEVKVWSQSWKARNLSENIRQLRASSKIVVRFT